MYDDVGGGEKLCAGYIQMFTEVIVKTRVCAE